MNLLDRLLAHDAATTRELLLLAGPLTDEQLDRDFDLGLRTLRRTLAHIVLNVEAWGDLMAGDAVNPATVVRPHSVVELTVRHLCAAARLAEVARDAERRGAWDETFLDTLDAPPARKSLGGGVAHVITHSMHHRCQALHMLRRLGVAGVPEGDVLSWEARSGSP